MSLSALSCYLRLYIVVYSLQRVVNCHSSSSSSKLSATRPRAGLDCALVVGSCLCTLTFLSSRVVVRLSFGSSVLPPSLAPAADASPLSSRRFCPPPPPLPPIVTVVVGGLLLVCSLTLASSSFSSDPRTADGVCFTVVLSCSSLLPPPSFTAHNRPSSSTSTTTPSASTAVSRGRAASRTAIRSNRFLSAASSAADRPASRRRKNAGFSGAVYTGVFDFLPIPH